MPNLSRYVRGLTPSQNMGLSPCNVLHPPFMQYEACSQVGQLLRNQTPISYRPPNPVITPLCAFGCHQISSSNDAVYHMQWPSPAMMYADSYGHFRHGILQVCTTLTPHTCQCFAFTDNARFRVVIMFNFCRRQHTSIL